MIRMAIRGGFPPIRGVFGANLFPIETNPSLLPD